MAQEVVKIGVAGPLSGEIAHLGKAMENGAHHRAGRAHHFQCQHVFAHRAAGAHAADGGVGAGIDREEQAWALER